MSSWCWDRACPLSQYNIIYRHHCCPLSSRAEMSSWCWDRTCRLSQYNIIYRHHCRPLSSRAEMSSWCWDRACCLSKYNIIHTSAPLPDPAFELLTNCILDSFKSDLLIRFVRIRNNWPDPSWHFVTRKDVQLSPRGDGQGPTLSMAHGFHIFLISC